MKKPAWFAYAEKVKAKIVLLAQSSESGKNHISIALDSHQVARDKHGYPGTLSDWQYLLESLPNQPPNAP
ncbi:MAG TPA: hypothetical protein VFZ59_17450 [Verrucomicrobiae bacterium]|nr:hypothetical protein [Verrucomicrobiae bacterium]